MPTLDLSALSDVKLMFIYLDVLPRDATHCMDDMRKQVYAVEIETNHGKKKRMIYVPSSYLKWVQQRIRHGLLLQLPVEDVVHGFRRERGILTNANGHAGGRKSWVMNVDLKNFFPTITPQRVFGFFSKVFNLNDSVAMAMRDLTTFHQHLCQGFPTSPDIANFVAWKLDRRLMGMAGKQRISYTRYADDLTFSSETPTPSPEKILRKVRDIVTDEGFRVNEEKIAVMRMGARKKVTGLVVGDDGTVNIPRRTRRLLRSAVHHWPQQTPERKASIMGWISYLHGADPVLALKLKAAIIKSEADAKSRKWDKNVGHHPFSEDVASGRIETTKE